MPKVTNQHSSLNRNILRHLDGWQLCCLLSCALVCFVFSLTGCVKAPGTERDQRIFISEEKEIALGEAAFRDVLKNARLNNNPEINTMVNRVGRRIVNVANKPNYHWEFVVLQDDDRVDAFALPGGKVVVTTGILKYTQDEAGLATIMAHLIAQVIQRHGAERLSRKILKQIAQAGEKSGAESEGIDHQKQIAQESFTRIQESEADYIGLQLMAQAGYDPREAVGFHKRMAGVPEYSHLFSDKRTKQIEAWIPEAMQFYNAVPASSTR